MWLRASGTHQKRLLDTDQTRCHVSPWRGEWPLSESWLEPALWRTWRTLSSRRTPPCPADGSPCVFISPANYDTGTYVFCFQLNFSMMKYAVHCALTITRNRFVKNCNTYRYWYNTAPITAHRHRVATFFFQQACQQTSHPQLTNQQIFTLYKKQLIQIFRPGIYNTEEKFLKGLS